MFSSCLFLQYFTRGKALSSMWRVDPRTQCDLITQVSNQIPLILNVKKKHINACLSTTNCIVKIITEIAM